MSFSRCRHCAGYRYTTHSRVGQSTPWSWWLWSRRALTGRCLTSAALHLTQSAVQLSGGISGSVEELDYNFTVVLRLLLNLAIGGDSLENRMQYAQLKQLKPTISWVVCAVFVEHKVVILGKNHDRKSHDFQVKVE